MSKPLFSIITITFNSEKTVERTLKSVLNQTYKDYEYIIVDGASKDGTMDIVRKYEPLFEGRMKWKSEPDTGIYNAMNKGIMRSTGEIIGIVNSDDWLEPDALNVVAGLAEKEDDKYNALCCGSLYFHYVSGEKQLFKSNKERFYAGIPHHSYNFGIYHPAVFVGKHIYESVGAFDENFKIEADTDFIYRCYKENKKFVFTDLPLSNMADGGASNDINIKKYYREKKYFIKKNNLKGIVAITTMLKFLVIIFLKKYLPASFLKFYRSTKV